MQSSLPRGVHVLRTAALLGLLVFTGCGSSSSGQDAGAEAQFFDGGFVYITSCATGLTPQCAADIYGTVGAKIADNTHLFALSAAQGGYLTLDQADAGASTLFFGEVDEQNAALGLLYVESLLFSEAANNANLTYIDFNVSAVGRSAGQVDIALEYLLGFLGDPALLVADGGPTGAASALFQDALVVQVAAGELQIFFNSPVDFQFTPNYAVLDMARAMGVFWLYQSLQQDLYGPQVNAYIRTEVLPQYADEVAHFAAQARARAATRCTEQPVSPVCATVAFYEAQTIAPALDALAAQMLLTADAGPH